MDFELFKEKLRGLLVECGCSEKGEIQIECFPPHQEQSINMSNPHDSRIDAFKAVRSVTPLKIQFTVYTEQAGHFHHISGDDRRLHPDMRTRGI